MADSAVPHDRVWRDPTDIATPYGVSGTLQMKTRFLGGLATIVVADIVTYMINPSILIDSSPIIHGHTSDEITESLRKNGALAWPTYKQQELVRAIDTIFYWCKTINTKHPEIVYSVIDGKSTNQIMKLAARLDDDRVDVDQRIRLIGAEPRVISADAKMALVDQHAHQDLTMNASFEDAKRSSSQHTNAPSLDAAQGYAAAITEGMLTGGVCDNLRGLIKRVANNTNMPANVRIMQIDTFVRNAYQARCLLQ